MKIEPIVYQGIDEEWQTIEDFFDDPRKEGADYTAPDMSL